MKSILIRDIDSETLAALKKLAQYHNRSLQGELHQILQRAAKTLPRTASPDLDLVTVTTGGGSSWTRDEIYGDENR